MDEFCKALVFNGLAEVTSFDTTLLVREAAAIHHTSPVATVALGKALSVAAFMSTSLKNEGDKFSVTIDGDGPMGKLVMAGTFLKVRGYVDNPDVSIPPLGNGKQNTRAAFGNGTMCVIKDLGLKECYSGKSELVNGNVDEDFAWYFTKSEGCPTALAMAVNLDENGLCTSAGGIVIQTLPNCTDDILVILEDIAMSFATMDKLVAMHDPHKLIDDFFGHFEIEYLPSQTPKYCCICSDDYMDGVVRSIGRNECVNILMEQGQIEIQCHFCNKKYRFDKQAVIDIWQRYDALNKKD